MIIENKGANTPFIFYKILFKDILEIFDKFLSFSTYTRNFLTISSKKSPTSISRGWIAFFIFLKLFQKYDIIKSIKGNKKGVFLE